MVVRTPLDSLRYVLGFRASLPSYISTFDGRRQHRVLTLDPYSRCVVDVPISLGVGQSKC